MESSCQVTIFADYFQFVLQDQWSSDDFADIWSDDALHRMLAVGRSAVCPATLRNVDVLVKVLVLPQAPEVCLAEYDHAVTGSMEIPSGVVAIMGCTQYIAEATLLNVPPGTYELLYLISGVSTIKTEWEAADDLYTVYLWPGVRRDTRLLKHWRTAP